MIVVADDGKDIGEDYGFDRGYRRAAEQRAGVLGGRERYADRGEERAGRDGHRAAREGDGRRCGRDAELHAGGYGRGVRSTSTTANGQLTVAGVTLDRSTYTVEVVASDGTDSARITVTINVVLNTRAGIRGTSTLAGA